MRVSIVDLGENIKNARQALGWSQSFLAESAGLSPACVSMIESNVRVPALESLIKIAKAMRCNVDELISHDCSVSHDVVNNFYRKFGLIDDLSESSQAIILALIKELKLN